MITLPISEIPNLPRLPPSSKANTRKSTSCGNGGSSSLPDERPISSSLGQQHGTLRTSCIKQQVPGVEVPAQYTLLVKSLQGQEDFCCPQLHLLFIYSPCSPVVPMGSQSPALSQWWLFAELATGQACSPRGLPHGWIRHTGFARAGQGNTCRKLPLTQGQEGLTL